MKPMVGEAIRMERWYCPDCERILKRPPYLDAAGDRRHSWRCNTPMLDAVIYVHEAQR